MPKVCHCEEAVGRRGALSAKREEVPFGVQSGRKLRFRRGLPVIQLCTARLPRRFAPRNDTSGSAAVHQCPPAVEWLCTRRSLTAATVKFGSACGRRWLVRAATAFPRLPRRFAPRNDKLGGHCLFNIGPHFPPVQRRAGLSPPYNDACGRRWPVPDREYRAIVDPFKTQGSTAQFSEHSARDFSLRRGLKSADVLCVPQTFRTDGSAKNIRRRPKMQLCGVALKIPAF